MNSAGGASMKSRGKSPGLAAASTASNSSSGGGGHRQHQHHRHQRASTSSQRGSVSGRSDSGAATASSDNTLAVPSSASSNHRHSDAASDVGVSYHHNSPSSILDASSSSATSPNHLLDLSGKPLSAVQGEHGNSVFYDDPDSSAHLLAYHGHDPELTHKAISTTQTKIDRLKELISEEQRTMDGNVDEYLKLSQQAEDRQQQARIKQLFEKKNQKSAQTIAQQQKKLEEYRRKVSELQERGLRPRSSHRLGAGLKSVGGNIRDGVGNVISKPKELASKLKHKAFGSADNLDTLSKDSDKEKDGKKPTASRNPHGSASLPRDNSGGPGFASSTKHSRKCISDDGRRSERSVGTASREDVIDDDDEDSDESSDEDDDDDPHHLRSIPRNGAHPGGAAPPATAGAPRAKTSPQRGASAVSSSEWKTVMEELTMQKEVMEELRQQFRQEVEKLRQQHRREMEALTDELSGERERFERLEVQMNDMMELHQNEVINIKRDMDEKEEKVLYQSEEQLVDVREHLVSLETKVTSMEHQAAQQQYLNIEGLDTNDARAIIVKLVNIGITIVHILFFFVGTVMTAARPFVSSSPRLTATTILVCGVAWAYVRQEDLWAAYHARFPSLAQQQQDSPSVAAASGASPLSR